MKFQKIFKAGLIASAIVFAGAASLRALDLDSAPKQKYVARKVEAQMKSLNAALGLSADQAVAISKILTAKYSGERKQNRNSNITPDERAKLHKDLVESARAKILAVLNLGQQKKFTKTYLEQFGA